MANGTTALDPASDPTNSKYYEKDHPAYQPGKGVNTTSWVPQGSIPFGREAALGATELGIGSVGLPATIARGAWGAAHALDPTGTVPEVAPWMYPSGPEGYGTRLENALGVTPTGAGERIFAAGMRSAGSGLPFGPRAAAISGTTGALGQGMTEAGLPPWMGQSVDLLGGLYGGYRGVQSGGWWGRTGQPRSILEPPAGTPIPAVPPAGPTLNPDLIMGGEGGNVIPFPRGGAAPAPRPSPTPSPEGAAPSAAPAAAGGSREAAQMDRLIDLETQANQLARAHLMQNTYAPLTRFLGPFQAVANRWIARGAMSADPGVQAASSAARRILGLGVGTGLGVTSAQEQLPQPPQQ